MEADVYLDVKQGFMTLFLDTPPPLPPLRFALAFILVPRALSFLFAGGAFARVSCEGPAG